MKQRCPSGRGRRVVPDVLTIHGNDRGQKVGSAWSSNDSLGIPITVSHLIVSPFIPRSSLLPILFREERQAGDIQKRNNRDPDVKYDIGSFWQGIPTGDLGVLLLVPSADLIKGCGDDNKPKNRVEVVLQWAASVRGFGLEYVDEVADDDLDDVEDEKYESNSRVCAVEVTTTFFGNDTDAKGEANDDEGSGDEGLYSLVSLKPNGGRGPEVSRD
jgi:hypothetical protein